MNSTHEPRWYGFLELMLLFGTFVLVYSIWKVAILAAIAAIVVWGLTIVAINIWARKNKVQRIGWRRLLDILHIWPG